MIERSSTLALTLLLLLGQTASGGLSVAHAGQPFLVNGVPTQERPTTGALLRVDSGSLVGICSGTLVGCQHFLTAAHCVCAGDDFASCGFSDPAQHRVYLQHAGVLEVSAIDVNPAFVFGTAGDVAVLTLASPVSGIRPTAINTTGDPSPGASGVIAGFGTTGPPNSDFGLLRHGSVVLASCGDVAPVPEHLCWTSDLFLAPGVGASTCFGDSGGPLFVNLGSGNVLAGVTSGGRSIDCLPPDVSFDANVFRNRGFIESIGGADLTSTACGSFSQVDDAGTLVNTVLFDGWSSSRRCRQEITKRYRRYIGTKLTLMQKCMALVNSGAITGPCPDRFTRDQIESASAKVAASKIQKRCAPAIIPSILAAGRCENAVEPTDLVHCILDAGDTAVANVLDVEYADIGASRPIEAADALTCQTAIARASGRYGTRRLELLVRCQTAEDKGRVATCPDPRTLGKITRLADSTRRRIEMKCTDALVRNLEARGGFGGACAGASSTAALVACEIAAHDSETDAIFALLDSVEMKRRANITVAAGSARLRVTLNGIDRRNNDLDLFVRHGAPPTTEVFDASSVNGGVYEGIDLSSPAAGTWHVLADPVRGATVPFQLTISAFPQ